MFTNPQRTNSNEAKQSRRAVGEWLKKVRLQQKLVQRDVADAIKLRYYTQWAQIENGVGRVPPDRYHLLAAALGVDPGPLARRLMQGYDPETLKLIFGTELEPDPSPSSTPLQKPIVVPTYGAGTAKELRQSAGNWLKNQREAVGLAQTTLAERLGYRFYSRVSQIERGVGRVPPDEYVAYATALGVETRDFVKTLFSFYDPMVHYLVFIDRA